MVAAVSPLYLKPALLSPHVGAEGSSGPGGPSSFRCAMRAVDAGRGRVESFVPLGVMVGVLGRVFGVLVR